jgi:hypothetical protein
MVVRVPDGLQPWRAGREYICFEVLGQGSRDVVDALGARAACRDGQRPAPLSTHQQGPWPLARAVTRFSARRTLAR